jgi:hypothetical protein
MTKHRKVKNRNLDKVAVAVWAAEAVSAAICCISAANFLLLLFGLVP